MKPLIGVCVFCGSSEGNDPIYKETAERLGRHLAENNARMIYGGAAIGLMGAAAKAAIATGGEVVGIVPQFLREREVELNTLTELLITTDMHERKEHMHKRADAYVILPGGIGTLEEVLEALTWAQLGQHSKPIVFVNTSGYWNLLFDLFAHIRDSKFALYGLEEFYLVVDEPDQALPAIRSALRSVTKISSQTIGVDGH